jgi:hypothetical protein
MGVTGWCLHGRHDRCNHRVGGPCHSGITLTDGGRWRCPCECHSSPKLRAAQLELELFGVV